MRARALCGRSAPTSNLTPNGSALDINKKKKTFQDDILLVYEVAAHNYLPLLPMYENKCVAFRKKSQLIWRECECDYPIIIL